MIQPVFTLLCNKDIDMAMVTISRMLKFMSSEQDFIIVDDGSLTQESIDKLKGLSSQIKIILRKERESFILSELGDRKNCIEYRNKFPFAFKLIDIPLIAKTMSDRYTYTDSDIVYLKNCYAYFQSDVNTYLRTDAIKISVRLKDALLKYRWKIPYKFNAGYFSYDFSGFDLDFIEYYLGLEDVYNMPWLSEQTCWALMWGRDNSDKYCPKEDEFVCQEIFDKPTVRTNAIHLIAGLKDKYLPWSDEELIQNLSKEGTFEPTFDKSRNVTYLDWIQKSFKRLCK